MSELCEPFTKGRAGEEQAAGCSLLVLDPPSATHTRAPRGRSLPTVVRRENFEPGHVANPKTVSSHYRMKAIRCAGYAANVQESR
jgi:hypothetical protein